MFLNKVHCSLVMHEVIATVPADYLSEYYIQCIITYLCMHLCIIVLLIATTKKTNTVTLSFAADITLM